MTTTSTAVVVYDPERADPEKFALSGFLGGYRGLTRQAYDLDLRQFVAFCSARQLALFQVRHGYRGLRPRDRGTREGPSDRRPAALHRRRLLPIRRGGGPHRPLASGPRAAPAP